MNFTEGEYIFINKPYGMTSFGALAYVRTRLSRRLGIKRLKTGHAGTLDEAPSRNVHDKTPFVEAGASIRGALHPYSIGTAPRGAASQGTARHAVHDTARGQGKLISLCAGNPSPEKMKSSVSTRGFCHL